MGREAVNGYPEKSLYTNKKFSGIVATSDPLNEGSFALLTNWDIVDTGLSMVPRKGFTSTTFKIGSSTELLTHKVLMYRDPNIQRDIVLDINRDLPFAFLTNITQFNLVNNVLGNSTLITGYDVDDLISFMSDRIKTLDDLIAEEGADKETVQTRYIFSHSTIIKDSQLTPITDLDGVTYYITKLSFDDSETAGALVASKFKYWLKVLYRPDKTTIGGVTYAADTLVLSCVDTEKQTTVFTDRNLASTVSIIPSPLRVVEDESVILTQASEVSRPILLNINGKYSTKNIPNTYKDSLDIQIHPTFYLEKPTNILTGANPKWAYRFDIINSGTASPIPLYKTPWRQLKYTEGAQTNPTINDILISKDNANDEYYTYYVVSNATHSWLEKLDASEYLESLEKAEEILYAKMRLNGLSGSSGSKLGNLAFAYLKHETLVNTLKPASIEIDAIDATIYDQMRFSFIPEESINTAVLTKGYDINALVDRVVSLDTTTVDNAAAAPASYTATTHSVSAPIIPMTYEEYNAATKYSLLEFKNHAATMSKSKRIRLIFVPNIYRHKGMVLTVPTDNVYLCSIGGIYVSGLKALHGYATGDIAPYANVVSVKKKFVFGETKAEAYVDVFDRLDNMNIKDILNTVPRSCFTEGVFLKLYLKAYDDGMLATYVDKTTQELELINASWDASSFLQSSVNVWANPKDVVYIDEVDEENPVYINNSDNWVVFEDRLVVWNGNKVFISEEGDYGYFNKIMKKEFPQEVLKVLVFKTVLLVFTTQNLHAIYRAEIDTATGTYTADGLPEYTSAIVWLQQPVLYNINPERRYLDVIQVYNQMVLFYSNEGQLYMIKSSTMINSETEFTIQYFNKSANNIIGNYDAYINDRLIGYKKLAADDTANYVTKDKVFIKALIDIDMIKVFYTVPGRITFVLKYDVVNNKYTTYDTLSFTEIDSVRHVEGGELYITKDSDNTYFTMPVNGINNVDQNVDMHYAKMFKKEPILTFLDTGNLNLNTHIRKRMRDLHMVIKNLDSTKILYNAELLLDDSVIRPFYGPDFVVTMLNGPDATITVDKTPVEDMNELFGMDQTIGVEGARTELNSYYLHEDAEFFERNALLNTETLNSSRLIEYKSSILGLGKVVRIRMQFIAKGKYKLQSFGITYKERRL